MVCPHCDTEITQVSFRQYISRNGYGEVRLSEFYIPEDQRRFYLTSDAARPFSTAIADHQVDDYGDEDYGDIEYQCPECSEDLSDNEVIQALIYDGAINVIPQSTPPRRQSMEQDRILHTGRTSNSTIGGNDEPVLLRYIRSALTNSGTEGLAGVDTCPNCNKDVLIIQSTENICIYCGTELTSN
jgi:DNA-directed RNA polymerase subunit RPC12/RpoP